jgi:hypothetical protein
MDANECKIKNVKCKNGMPSFYILNFTSLFPILHFTFLIFNFDHTLTNRPLA